MTRITRRESLKWLLGTAAAAAGGVWLGGCAPGDTPPPASTAPATSTVRPTIVAATRAAAETTGPRPSTSPLATQGPPEPLPTQPAYPDLVVARGGEPEPLVRQALDALGGMARFVPAGADVIVKPNICVAYHDYTYAATTNPWVVGALVALCFEAGARRVRVMDNPFGGTADQAYAVSGIADEVRAAGGEMEVMSRLKWIDAELPGAASLKTAAIYEDVLTADVIINVPIAKHHSLARLTLGMKNLMGTIRDREKIHADMGRRLADLAGFVRPELTVIDAVRILTAGGPTGGNLAAVQKVDTLIVSADIVAADSYATTLFGLQPDDIAYIRAGAAAGLGRSDLAGLHIEEVAVGS